MDAQILITDDTIFTRTVLKSILSANGFKNVIEASNGEEAIKLYKLNRPDVVLMDITMPVMNGIEALKEIRAFDPEAKIIMCTAMGQRSMVVEAIQAGAKDFVAKPFQTNRILESVRKLVDAEAA
ncbi:MAG TPA: response regulator [Fimbriimonadaceae bacterium]|nr:response regulator [Fimbriimonadaceae bacterium]